MVHQAADGAKHPMAPMLFGLRVLMLGRQGSGKGTQGVQLARLLVVPHISVGDVLREAARSGSPAGWQAQATMERGELIGDDLVVSLVAERMGGGDVRSGGFVLDGFPRTLEQAEAPVGILADGTLDRAVVIDVPLEVARARLLARRVCAGCGRPDRSTGVQRGAWAPVIMAARSSGCRKEGGGGGPQANRPRAPSRSSGVHSWSSTMQSMSL